MKKTAVFILILFISITLFAAEKTPDPFIKLKVNDVVYKTGAEIKVRPGEKINLEAKVYGGRRAWCMEPQKYANTGRNTVIQQNDENGLTFTTGPGFKGVWKIKSETAAWFGQLNNYLEADPVKNTAVLTVPQKTGSYILTVKATAVWHYNRTAQGMKRERDEENKAEAVFTVVAGQAEDVWFSSENITAGGDKEDDIEFRLQSVQQLWGVVSKQALDGKYENCRANLSVMSEHLRQISLSMDRIKKEKPEFKCKITFFGLPTDKAKKCLDAFIELKGKLKDAFKISSGNIQAINEKLLKTKMVFTGNVLKSVFKNYIEWGANIPNFNDLYSGANTLVGLTVFRDLAIPTNIMQWYVTAQEDASILNNQAKSMQNLRGLLAFYEKLNRSEIDFSRKVNDSIDKNKPVEALEIQAKQLLSSPEWATWKAK